MENTLCSIRHSLGSAGYSDLMTTGYNSSLQDDSIYRKLMVNVAVKSQPHHLHMPIWISYTKTSYSCLVMLKTKISVSRGQKSGGT